MMETSADASVELEERPEDTNQLQPHTGEETHQEHPSSTAETVVEWDERDCKTNHPGAWKKPQPKDAKKASELKADGNKCVSVCWLVITCANETYRSRCFASHEFEQAIELYSQAIAYNPDDEEHAYSMVSPCDIART
jgi:hypothetical protein